MEDGGLRWEYMVGTENWGETYRVKTESNECSLRTERDMSDMVMRVALTMRTKGGTK